MLIVCGSFNTMTEKLQILLFLMCVQYFLTKSSGFMHLLPLSCHRSFFKITVFRPTSQYLDQKLNWLASPIVTRNNIVRKLIRGYCLCYCKTFLLVPDSTQCKKKIYYQKSGVYYLCHLKSNHIGQRKSTDKEKHLSMIDFV